MRIHIWSHFAADWNDHRANLIATSDDPNIEQKLDPARNEVWQGLVPDAELGGTMEGVFRFFNRVEEGDADRLERLGYDLPSLSTDDIVTADGKSWKVEPVGFSEVKNHVGFTQVKREYRAGGIPGDGWPATTLSD